jgi:hypothetical protein
MVPGARRHLSPISGLKGRVFTSVLRGGRGRPQAVVAIFCRMCWILSSSVAFVNGLTM